MGRYVPAHRNYLHTNSFVLLIPNMQRAATLRWQRFNCDYPQEDKDDLYCFSLPHGAVCDTHPGFHNRQTAPMRCLFDRVIDTSTLVRCAMTLAVNCLRLVAGRGCSVIELQCESKGEIRPTPGAITPRQLFVHLARRRYKRLDRCCPPVIRCSGRTTSRLS